MIETHEDTFSTRTTLVGRCRWWGVPALTLLNELDHGNAESKKSHAQIEKNLHPHTPPQKNNWLVVSNMFYFHPYLGKIPNLFQRGWNHQLDKIAVDVL